MRCKTGVFPTRGGAEAAMRQLREFLPADRVMVLTPETDEKELESVSTTKDMRGVGGTIGGAIGGSAGATAGMALTVLLTPAAPVLAIGCGAAVLLGAAGVAAGAAAGDALDEAAFEGLPVDELHVYEDALEKGRSVVLAFCESDQEMARAEDLLIENNAESIDAARESWWVGLRDDPDYEPPEGREDESPSFRAGFESAYSLRWRGKNLDDVIEQVRELHAGHVDSDEFREGWERGKKMVDARLARSRHSSAGHAASGVGSEPSHR